MNDTPRVFLLSPASTAGKRAQRLLNERATFPLARQLHSGEGAPVGDVFSFLSGLYFRGKLTYARAFAADTDIIRIITSDRGLVAPERFITLEDLRRMALQAIDDAQLPYRIPLERDARALLSRIDEKTCVVLLGSVATDKYVRVLSEVFGAQLVFPTDFAGRGDMSRGGLMLRCAREGRELDYSPIMTSTRRSTRPPKLGIAITLPVSGDAEIVVGGRTVTLTNLGKLYWPADGITKGTLLQYYADIAPVLLPHIRNRAMVMKRYPNGIDGKCFFMKHAPSPRPDWIDICRIEHASGNVVAFPVVQDLASLLWLVNLGCIDLNQWYATCDDVDRPDYLHFDLDPVPGADFEKVTEAALVVRDALHALKLPTYVKTTGSRGFHIYVPIVRGPVQKQVWSFAKALANALAVDHPKLLTAVYRVADRPRGRILVDYNQNAWGRTLASVYSPRPRPGAPVSTPVTWEEVERGVHIGDFTIANVPARVRALGDLWKPVLLQKGRFRLENVL